MNKKILISHILSGGQAVPSPPTESELFDYIKTNMTPSIWLQGDSGLADISGNSVVLSYNGGTGTPSIVTNQLDTHSVIRFDGTNDVIWFPRIDFKSIVFVFKESGTGTTTKWMLLNAQDNSNWGQCQGFFKRSTIDAEGFYTGLYMWSPSPASSGRLVSEINTTGSGFNGFIGRSASSLRRDGKGVVRKQRSSTALDASGTYSTLGCASYGDKSNPTGFVAMDIAEIILFTSILTIDQEYIINAYLETRYPSLYPKLTYLYTVPSITKEASNPVIAGNANEDNPSAKQSYSGNIIYDGSLAGAMQKTSQKKMGLWSTANGIAFTDQPLGTTYGGAGSFDEAGINTMIPFKEGSTRYAYVTGINASGDYQLGLKTAASWLGSWSSVQTTPVISLATINAALSKSYVESQIYGMAKINGEYYVYLTCSAGHDNNYVGEIVLVKGSDKLSLSVVGVILDKTYSMQKEGLVTNWSNDNAEITLGGYGDCKWVEVGAVVWYQPVGKYVAYITFGNRDLYNTNGTKVVHIGISDDAVTWKILGRPAYVTVDDTWESAATYHPQILADVSDRLTPVKVSNKYRLYYAGLQNSNDSPYENINGQTGLAYADKLIDVLTL